MQTESGILLFGGTFDPIHHGHLIIGRSVAEQLGVERIILIPAALPPHKQKKFFSAPGDRLEMARRAVAGEPRFEVSDCELARTGPSYTLDTIRHYRQAYGPALPLYWLIGSDSLRELHTWHEAGQLVEECNIVTAARRGFDTVDLAGLAGKLTPGQVENLKKYLLPTPIIEISATEIRQRVARGLPISYLVPPAVAEYINRQQLYRQ